MEFVLVEDKPKTQVWSVVSKEHYFPLGTIKWFGRWRQYAFFPEADTVFNKDCLDDLRVFIADLMLKRKEAGRAKIPHR